MIGPKELAPLTEEQLVGLIECFTNNKQMKSYPGRSFGLDLDPAMEIVTKSTGVQECRES